MYGDEHIWTAEIYSHVALMHSEQDSNQLASPWIRKSFVSCYKAVGINHKSVRVLYTHLQNIEASIGSPLASVPIEFVVSKINQMQY